MGKAGSDQSGNFKHPVRDSALTALAGPMSNFVLAFAVALPLRYIGGNPELYAYMPGALETLLWMIFHISIFLGIFNLFPIPPLDGSKILGLIMPKAWYSGYERYSRGGIKYLAVFIIFDVFVLGRIFGFSIFGTVMWYLHDIISTVLLLGM